MKDWKQIVIEHIFSAVGLTISMFGFLVWKDIPAIVAGIVFIIISIILTKSSNKEE
jgi:hypothetical protein